MLIRAERHTSLGITVTNTSSRFLTEFEKSHWRGRETAGTWTMCKTAMNLQGRETGDTLNVKCL